MPQKIIVTDVGPRDGFQNLQEYIPVETKIAIIDGIFKSGVESMQITSFVSPKAIPQMADSGVITDMCLEKYGDKDIFALIPNLKGAQLAVQHGLKKMTTVISLSESHNKANVRRTHEESIEELKKIKDQFPDIDLMVDMATTFGCPFEGKQPLDKVVDFIGQLQECGITTVNLCDTVGMADPGLVRTVVKKVKEVYPDIYFCLHIHDTRGMGLANTLAGIECGIENVQSTLGGLGGCPFAPGASGNTATEDLVYMLNMMGFDTGIDFEKLLEIAKYQKSIIDGNYSGHHININKNSCCG